MAHVSAICGETGRGTPGGTRPPGGRRRQRQRPRGAALIEMIFVTLVLFFLAMGTVEFGWYLYAKHTTQAAARDGCRAGIVAGATHAQCTAAINRTMAAAGFGSIGYTVTYEEVQTDAAGSIAIVPASNISTVERGHGLRITIAAPFSAFGVNPLGRIGPTKEVTGVSLMVKE